MASGNSVIKLKVKWAKKVFDNIEVDTTESPQVFKMQLWTLTGVPPERQSVLGLRGGKLKDDADWAKTGIKAGMTLMLIGTAEETATVAPPKDIPKVRDDLDATYEDQANYAPIDATPPGLTNMGNTCYMNATVQCLNAVKPLSDALKEYKGSTSALGPDEKLSASLRDLFGRLSSANSPSIDPSAFLATLRQVNPQFAERQSFMYMQQDAEECFGEILSRLSSALKTVQEGVGSSAGQGDNNAANNKIDELFAIETKSVDTCEEEDTGESIERYETIRTLKCHISISVNHVAQGIEEGLEEEIEKFSDKLGRTAKWKRTNRLNRLPPFLIVQFVRFFWKPAERVKAKILRNVSFPVNLDLYNFCTEMLQKKLDEKRANALKSEGGPDTPMTEEQTDVAGATQTSERAVTTATPAAKASSCDGVEADIGNYELCAVLTHKGRTVDSGHYVAWVKDSDKAWYKFDDDKVSVQTEEDVKKLSGGGDWHMAYICLYRAKRTF